MADVRICHKEVVITDTRVSATTLCSPMKVHVFSKNIVVAYGKKCFFTLVLQILRLQTDRPERIELIALADFRRTFHDNVRLEAASLSDLNAWTDAAIRPDADVIANFRFRTDNGGSVDHGCCPIEESRMASAASSGPT